MTRRRFAVVFLVAILGVVALASFTHLNVEVDCCHGKRAQLAADLRSLRTGLAAYKTLNGFYPTTEQGLQALVVQPDSDPKPTGWYQLFNTMPKDPWHSNYVYRCPGVKNPNGYDLFCVGPDRIPDTADDDWGL